MRSQKAIKLENVLRNHIESKGHNPDSYGNYKVGAYRIKFKTNCFRIETNRSGAWKKINGAYCSDDAATEILNKYI